MSANRRRAARRAWIVWFSLLGIAAVGQRWIIDKPVSGGSATSSVLDLQQKNLLLSRQISSLEQQLQLISGRDVRNAGDSSFLGFRPVPARVLPYRDPDPKSRTILLDVGAADGVVAGQGVMGPRGLLVGRVAEVHGAHSLVRLADDPSFRAKFRVGKATGIVAGGPEPREVRPLRLADSHQFARGELLVTSGDDGLFPPDLVIGWVTHLRLPVTRTRISLALDPEALEVVAVLTPPTLEGAKR